MFELLFGLIILYFGVRFCKAGVAGIRSGASSIVNAVKEMFSK